MIEMIENNLKPLRWGIIGCGDVTEIKSGPAYQQTEGFELVAVMRRSLKKAEDYAKRHGVPKYYDDAEALIEDHEVDAVYIATPPDSHMYYALKVAKAGKPCCIEKPMARNFDECVKINQAFKNHGIPLFVAYYRRTLPRFLKVKEWLERDLIGKVRHVNWVLNQAPSKIDLEGSYNWRTDKVVAPGGYFDDLASHGIDLFSFLLGDITKARGYSLNRAGLYSAPDTVAGAWLHNSGITGTGTWNFGVAGETDRVEIYGSKGSISFSVFHDHPLSIEVGNEKKEMAIAHPNPIQLPHVTAMQIAMTKGVGHPSTGDTAMLTNWVMDSILGLAVENDNQEINMKG
jgi:predicted dehydrogenase